MSQNRTRRVGITQVALSGAFFGVLGVLGKHLFKQGMSPGELLAFRFLLAGLFLWPVIWVRFPRRWRLMPRQLASCAFLGIAGYALFSSCFFMALQGVSASLTVLLLYAYPVLVSAFGWWLFDEKIPSKKLPAFPLAIFGVVLLVWGEFSVQTFGALLFGVCSAVFYSVYILASSRLLKGIHPLVSLTYILTFAGIALSALHLRDFGRSVELVRHGWPALTALVLIGTIGAMSLFLAGLQHLQPWEVSLLSTLEPVTGVALAAIFLHEQLGWVQALGGASVLAGQVFVALGTEKTT